MDYRIAIKTHRRPGLVHRYTLRTLEEGNVDLDRVTLFADADQESDYRAAGWTGGYCGMVEPGIRAVSNCIAAYYPEGAAVVHMDDDVERIERVAEDQRGFVPVWDVDEFFRYAFERLDGLSLWGVYPARNRGWMLKAPEETRDLKFIWDGLYGFLSRPSATDLFIQVAVLKNDFERSIRYYRRDGGVLRLNRFHGKTRYYPAEGSGGAADLKNRDRLHVQDARSLASAFPEHCHTRRKKGFGGLDLALRSK